MNGIDVTKAVEEMRKVRLRLEQEKQEARRKVQLAGKVSIQEAVRLATESIRLFGLALVDLQATMDKVAAAFAQLKEAIEDWTPEDTEL